MNDPLLDTLQQTLGTAYHIERELGGGGMSRVFVAQDTTLDREVVVKVLMAESTNGVSGERFRREIQVIAKLQHPHIVSILSAGAADGTLYYIMPFVKGETLRARMSREGPFKIADTVKVLREVLDALAFAHEQGVVHRDIKPENVLIEAGHALVADFGIAKALHESGSMTSAGIALGTPTYMAPEQATADPTTDHRADLYAVGVLAYELLIGTPPFCGSAQQVITAHITTPAPALRVRRADVPVVLADLIARALAKEPSARPQSANEMQAALEEVPTPGGITARAANVTASPKRIGAFVGVAVLAVVLAVALVMKSRSASAAPAVADGAELIAVMPLGAASDTSLARLGKDLVVTLSANLDGVGALRTIDAATLLMRTRKLPSPMPLADAQRIARELGARSVMTGTLVGEGDLVRASVVLRVVGSDSTLAKATALAAPRDIAALTDSLSWQVLQDVWRKGKAPSPLLKGLTTASFDALRAFLDGERHFQQLNVTESLADYRRAFELDSTFAQAYLRYDYANEWNLRPRDSLVHARLLALKERLPEREQLWVETREHNIPLPEEVAEWKALSQRYPDYPPFLMAAADPIVHSGPIYGIPISDARPMLDRLDQLVPDHADSKLHQAAVSSAVDTPREAADAWSKAGALSSGVFAYFMTLMADLVRANVSGGPLPPVERALHLARLIAADAERDPVVLLFSGLTGFKPAPIPYQVDMIARVRRAGIYAGDVERSTGFSESALLSARGDWMGALAAARRTEPSALPMGMRLAGARIAGLGAWLEAVDPHVADSIVRRARALPNASARALDRAELLWLDGVVGVALGDEQRVREAIRELSVDTSRLSRHTAGSLSGLWLNRTNPDAAADSLRVVTDDVMRNGSYVLAAEAVGRLVIARALRKRGEHAAVERYLMWPDGALNTPTLFGALMAAAPLTEFERGSAFDALGNRDAAIRHYRNFVDNYDQPPPAHRAKVDEAKQRLAALEKSDAPKARSIPP